MNELTTLRLESISLSLNTVVDELSELYNIIDKEKEKIKNEIYEALENCDDYDDWNDGCKILWNLCKIFPKRYGPDFGTAEILNNFGRYFEAEYKRSVIEFQRSKMKYKIGDIVCDKNHIGQSFKIIYSDPQLGMYDIQLIGKAVVYIVKEGDIAKKLD